MFRRNQKAIPTILPMVEPSVCRYRMVEKLASFGDDFFVQNDHGKRVFKIDGEALRTRNTLVIKDLDGREVCRVRELSARVRDSMEIADAIGNRSAWIQKSRLTPLRDRFVVKLRDGLDLEVRGNILDHEYRIGNVATVSKKWFRARDSYGVEIGPDQDDAVLLAATVCIEQLTSTSA